ncbi:MAG: MBG domain-containing protein, partial [Firmicutes bacterium]|nr:MBG domain-containing protein [Bacillota bacterium]
MKNRRFLSIAILVTVALTCVIALAACTHVCEHRCPICFGCQDLNCQDESCKAKCPNDHYTAHECTSKCPVCNRCQNLDCQKDACADKCQGNHNGNEEFPEYDMSGVSFADKTVTYNGSAQTLTVTGTLPEGVTVAYDYYSGDTKLTSEPVNAGSYTVIAKFTGDAEHKAIDSKTALLTVSKATYDMSNVSFANKTVTYNGLAQTLEVTGGLPEGVADAYEYYSGETKLTTAPVNAGTYTVVAKLIVGDAANYEAIADKTATLTISKATYDMSGITLPNDTVTYDGSAHTLAYTGTLPTGVTFGSYEYYDGTVAEANKLSSAPVNAGTYAVVAKFASSNANYEAVGSKTATLTIEKANIEVVLGATTDADDNELANEVTFIKNQDGTYSASVASDMTYYIDILDSNLDVDFAFYNTLNADNTVNSSLESNGELRAIGDVRYVLVTLLNDEDKLNYNDNLVLTVKGAKRVVEIYTYEDLLLLASDIETYSVGVRTSAVYKLMNDIDCGGNVWKTIGTRIASGSNVEEPYNESFLSELDGQGHKIYNYKITDESVDEENINYSDGIALGFFGFISTASVHDVTFADITVDFSVVRLSDTSKYGQNAFNGQRDSTF